MQRHLSVLVVVALLAFLAAAPSFGQLPALDVIPPEDVAGYEPSEVSDDLEDRPSAMDAEAAREELLGWAARLRQARERSEAQLRAHEQRSRTSSPAVTEAVNAIGQGLPAPVLEESSTRVFAFGQSQPKVSCTPGYACDVELAPGEEVYGVALGDPPRWVVNKLQSGDPDRATTHVLVTPREYGVGTNMVIGTNRRTYYVLLVSPERKELRGKGPGYVRHAKFYYPDELVEMWQTRDDVARLAESETDVEQALHAVEAAARTPLGDVHFGYRIRGSRRTAFRPTAVFDDAERTFVQLPKGLQSHPTVLALEGKTEVLPNYHVDEYSRLVVHGVFDRLRLIRGVGKRREVVTVERTEG